MEKQLNFFKILFLHVHVYTTHINSVVHPSLARTNICVCCVCVCVRMSVSVSVYITLTQPDVWRHLNLNEKKYEQHSENKLNEQGIAWIVRTFSTEFPPIKIFSFPVQPNSIRLPNTIGINLILYAIRAINLTQISITFKAGWPDWDHIYFSLWRTHASYRGVVSIDNARKHKLMRSFKIASNDSVFYVLWTFIIFQICFQLEGNLTNPYFLHLNVQKKKQKDITNK